MTPASPTRRSAFVDGGWSILAFATITSVLTGPGQTIGVSVFIDHFVEDLSLTRTQVTTAYMFGTLGGAALLPLVGRFVDRRGVRLSQILIGLAFGLALFNMSLVNGLVWLALGFFGIRFLGQGSLSLVATVTVSLRFLRNRGTALGIFSTVAGGLMAMVPWIMTGVIVWVGWRSAWVIAGLVVVVLVVSIGYFGLRDMPLGMARSGQSLLVEVAEDHGPAEGAGAYPREEAIRTRAFWLLAAVSASAGMLGTALNFHQIDLLTSAGLSKAAAAAMFLPQVIGSSVAGLGVGWVSDRVGTRYLPAVGMALLVSVLFLAAVVSPGVVVAVYAIVLGAMGGAVRTTTAVLLPKWFGTTHLGSIQGVLTLFNAGASALGPVALAVTQEGLGSYAKGAMVLASIPAAALIFSLAPLPALRPAE